MRDVRFDFAFGGFRFAQIPVSEMTGGDVLPDFRCRVAELFQMPGE